MKEFLKRFSPDVLVIVGFLILSFAYFATPIMEGLVLGGHDTVAGMGQGQEQSLFFQATGERTRWTNSIFSGMPTYQIAPAYGATDALGWVGRIFALFTAAPLSYLFLYLFGFYLLLRAFRLRPLISAFGATAWAFSTYFLIIIAAGHIWKVNTLAFIPPTIAGLVLAYRGKYLWGGLVTALFTALQVLSNHIQMTYYFLFLMAFIVVAYAVDAVRRGAVMQWAKATAIIVVGGVMGALINLPNLYHTWEYSKESMRGAGELSQPATNAKAAAAQTGGLDRDYITAWSYGIDETLTLLIPDFKGGGSASIMERNGVEDLDGYDEFYEKASQLQQATGGGYLPGTSQYWGDQPMTVGPVYVGAIICFLFVLGLFVVRGPIKWALLCGIVLSLLFAWGKHIMPLTDFFIDVLPMYAKFRTVSSALVVAELTIPLLGILALAELLKRPEQLFDTKRGRVALGTSVAATAGVALLFALAPTLSTLISQQDTQMLSQMQQMGLPADFVSGYRNAINTLHASILASSAWHSFFYVAFAAALIVGYAKRWLPLPAWSVVTLLLVVSLFDLWGINKRYLNNDNFSEPEARLEGFAKSPADEKILADKSLDYRVLNLSAGNPFNESSNQTAYWHKSVGGYHAAKLHRYQDLIDRYLNNECSAVMSSIDNAQKQIIGDSLNWAARGIRSEADLQTAMETSVQLDSVAPMLNMLNAKWFILNGGKTAFLNKAANGNAWFATQLAFVDDANAEMAALKDIDTKVSAVADKRFSAALNGSALGTGTVKLDSYVPNELHYSTTSAKGGVVVFSEIYYPGWTATIDGAPAEIGRANYVLRALKVPAGNHKIVFEFRPNSIATTDAISYASLALLALGFCFALWRTRCHKGEVAHETAA